MKNIDWKILNAALWIEVALSYVLPFRVIDGFQYKAGFPTPFLSIYNTEMNVSPLMSMNFNFLGFVFNGIVIYLILSFTVRLYRKRKNIK